jgi:hypothetical protein
MIAVVHCKNKLTRVPRFVVSAIDVYLGSANNSRISGLHVFALGDVFSQAPSHVVFACAPAGGVKIQVALALVGSITGVDDGQSLVRLDDSLASTSVGGPRAAGDRGEFGEGNGWRVVCGTGVSSGVAVSASESNEVDDRSLAAVVTG